MNESDFPQFDDPRVREVMAKAAGVVEWYEAMFGTISYLEGRPRIEALKTALFAAQHSKPKESVLHHTDACQMVDGYGDGCPRCKHILETGELP